MNPRRVVIDHLKNLKGFTTSRRIIILSVDDYGNVRVDSKEAREKMTLAGLKVLSRFDAYDTLETRSDLEALFDTLTSVKDINGNHAVFSPFTVPCNIDFERMEQENYHSYLYEPLPATFEKLSTVQPHAYSGAWELWKEGIKKGFLVPQFHGREHLNLKVFNEKLRKKDPEIICALKNRSYSSISDSGYPTIGYTAAFDFWDIRENIDFNEIISDGIKVFKEVFEHKPVHFNSPGYSASRTINKSLAENGIRFSDNPFLKKEHLGFGKYKTVFNYTGKKIESGLYNLCRNVVFEPCADKTIDWVSYTIKQIKTAFSLNKPAIISSHRINFCGHVDEFNRKKGLGDLKKLLSEITRKWPDAEFLPSTHLIREIEFQKRYEYISES